MLKSSYFIALALALCLMGTMCGSDDDDKTCTDAANHIADVLISEYNNDIDQMCETVYDNFSYELDMDYQDLLECQATPTIAELRSKYVPELATACADSEDGWGQEGIDCVCGASTVAQLQACAGK